MKNVTKKKVISLVLAFVMLASAIPVTKGVGANAAETGNVSIMHHGVMIQNLTLPEDEKETLYVQTDLSGDLKYSWQIQVSEDVWVNMKGFGKDFCNVSYALIGSVLDVRGRAFIRCSVSDGTDTYFSEPVTVTVLYSVPQTYKTDVIQKTAPSARQVVKKAVAVPAADDTFVSHTIIINYVYGDNSLAFEPYIATIEDGGQFTETVASPDIVGYEPFILKDGRYEPAQTVELNYDRVTADDEFTVVYRPALVNYMVNHYTQNVLDDYYELSQTTTGTALTGSQVPDCAIHIDGFSVLYYEHLTVAADGSTVIEIKYDRNYYLVDFDMAGGYGVEPVYTRYGATVGVNAPTRVGYVFAGWELVKIGGNEPTETDKTQYDINGRPITVPDKSLSYRAKWITAETTYTVVYWKENADDTNYSYWGSRQVGVMSADVVSGSDNIPADIAGDEALHFTYNDAKTDKNVLVEGDGSTIINVYYTRNTYTLTFVDGSTNDRTLTCRIPEHEHSDDVRCYGSCIHSHSLVCYRFGNNRTFYEAIKPEQITDPLANGQIYTYTIGERTYYYLYLDGKWYCSSNWAGTLGDPTQRIRLNCNHNHTNECLSCTQNEHTHTDSCYTYNNAVAAITAKYDAEIFDEFNKAPFNTTYNGRAWEDEDNSTYGYALQTLDRMPGVDEVFVLYRQSSDIEKTIYYYVQKVGTTVPGNSWPTAPGDNFELLKQVDTYFNYATYDEEYHEIQGFTRYDRRTAGFDNELSKNFSNNRLDLYYMRNSYQLRFYNYNTYVEGEDSTVQYEASLSSYNFTPTYPSGLEPNAYVFNGWYTTPDCFPGTELDFAAAVMPASDLTLYAKWAPIQHKVNVFLDATLQNQIGNTQFVDHNCFATLPDEDVSNGNYIFAGWFYKDQNDSEKAFVFNSMPIIRDMDIYAKWSSNVAVKYEVYYKTRLEDGTEIEIADPTIGSTLAGMNKTFFAKGGDELYESYQNGYFPDTNSHTVTMSVDGSNTFTFWYQPKESVPYIVRYLEVGTNKVLAEEKSFPDNRKAVVTEVFKPVTGYMPDAYQKRLVLKASDNPKDNVLIFWYTEDTEHAYYRIVHYIQNLAGDGYTEYRSIESPGTIGDTISAEALTIAGFEFKGDQSKVNGVVTPAVGSAVFGKLTGEGLLIELFYDRITVDYTVRYLEANTNKELATEKIVLNRKFGEQISENYIDIKGYDLVSERTQTITLAADSERNVITFYYQEQLINIQYIPVGEGVVSLGSENVPARTGVPNGSVPDPADGWRFDGWYLNEECTIPVAVDWIAENHKILPRPENGFYEEAIYYAKFVPDKASLMIVKSGDYSEYQSIDPNQSFVFEVSGKEETSDIHLTVTINGNGSITIADLPIGTYTVKEISDWSWRYTPVTVSAEITISPNGENKITFENNRTEKFWLDGDSYKANIFRN